MQQIESFVSLTRQRGEMSKGGWYREDGSSIQPRVVFAANSGEVGFGAVNK